VAATTQTINPCRPANPCRSLFPEEYELDKGVEKLNGKGEMPHGADLEYVV
jgi:hypothetical protein